MQYNFNNKYFNWAITVAFFICLYFLLVQYNKVRKLEKFKSETIDKIKSEKEQFIKNNYSLIDSLKNELHQSDIIIENSNKKIDSLNNVKEKIKVVYKDRIKEIDNYDSNELSKYWEDVFKD